jgi:hypothetical protein
MLFEKMMFLNEDNVGTAKEDVKDEQMLKEQRELTKAIDEERMKLKAMRD